MDVAVDYHSDYLRVTSSIRSCPATSAAVVAGVPAKKKRRFVYRVGLFASAAVAASVEWLFVGQLLGFRRGHVGHIFCESLPQANVVCHVFVVKVLWFIQNEKKSSCQSEAHLSSHPLIDFSRQSHASRILFVRKWGKPNNFTHFQHHFTLEGTVTQS
jgi:hypothetical protein